YLGLPERPRKELLADLSLSNAPFQPRRFVVTAVTGLAAASKSALMKLGKSKGGAPKDTTFVDLIAHLAVLYHHETGRAPSVTSDPVHDINSGTFFNFVWACCRAFAQQYAAKNNSALGRAVQRALEELPAGVRARWTEPDGSE